MPGFSPAIFCGSRAGSDAIGSIFRTFVGFIGVRGLALLRILAKLPIWNALQASSYFLKASTPVNSSNCPILLSFTLNS